MATGTDSRGNPANDQDSRGRNVPSPERQPGKPTEHDLADIAEALVPALPPTYDRQFVLQIVKNAYIAGKGSK